jgi:hypothetical protein
MTVQDYCIKPGTSSAVTASQGCHVAVTVLSQRLSA